ncbi:T9SS type B sorting domain-containing protein [Chryseobacterium herbae]|uniref:T9SS type B sorting domain-containing protein n=1 Tax=Chryseobacterium herbae TaxID=2976476 RepID=A0ABT2IV60_9FLAO|nr:T9SS type B sorting domain-containing protein [Chryseobacterium sp. pc1-10]MCT2562572.1 T9SS type B sorting domain-containing protein [Chryseobacterium sp. pc1-10]
MKKKLLIYFVTTLLFCSEKLVSQTYQLTGNPVNTTGWDLVSSVVNGDFIQLTSDQVSQFGAIKRSNPITLSYCEKWKVEFDFRIDGNGTSSCGKGDGFSFWYLANPPSGFVTGAGLGIPSNSSGLMVGFDTYNNDNGHAMSKVHLLYGTNNIAGSNIEYNNTPGSTFHSPNLNQTLPFVGSTYKHVEATGENDPANPGNWIIRVKINGVVIVNQSFSPSGAAVGLSQGYFGFSAATGCATSRHSIKNVKIFVDKVPILTDTVTSSLCVSSSTGSNTINLTSFNSQFVNNPGNYTFTYFISGSSTPIANPTNFQYSANTTIKVVVSDPSSGLCNNGDGKIQLNITHVTVPTITASANVICPATSVTLTSSNASGNTWSTGATTPSITVNTPGTYTLTNTNGNCTSQPSSIILTQDTDPNVQIAGNLVLCNAASTQLTASSAGTGNMYTWSTGATTPAITVTAPGTYTVTIKTPAGCRYQKSAVVIQGNVPVTQNTSLIQCSGTASALFNLTSAQPAISTTPGVTFAYYISQADAIAGNGNTIANPSAYTSGNAVIYVRIQSAECSKIAELQLIVTQTQVPIITASANAICPGTSVTLTSSNATGNTWSTGATTPSITVNTPGTYTLTNTNGSCTSQQSSITLTQDADPNVQITGNLVLCATASTQLTASSTGTGNTYTWSTGATTPAITVTAPGTYTVTVKTPAECRYQKSAVVIQGNVPVTQNTSLTQCSGTAFALFNLTSAQPAISTTPGVTFAYYITQADALAGNANTIANPSAYTSGNAVIYVRVQSADCSKIAELQLIVTQTQIPIITASANAICPGASVTLTSSNATGNTWSTGATTPSITVNTPGTYTLTNTNGSCTSQQSSITLTQDTDPNIQIAGNLTFCQGSPTILTATAASSGNIFTWSNGTTGPSNTVAAPGIYTVTVTTPPGCHYQKSVTVTMDPIIIVNIGTPESITCTNNQIMLNASASVYQPGATFLWTASAGGNIVSGANTLTPTVNAAGTYTLTITSNTPFGCVKQRSVTVIKNTNSPVISISASQLTICKGQSVTLTALGASTYIWNSLPGNGNIQTVSPSTTTTYSVTGTGFNGCQAQSPATITIKVVPEIVSALKDAELCEGDKIILDAGSGTGYTYLWNTGATTQTIDVTLAGTYSVRISNGVCSKTFTAKVSYIMVPQIKAITYKNNTLIIEATNNSNLPLEYSIDGGFTWQNSNVFTPVLKNTQYFIRVRTKGTSCYATGEYYTFFMANVITPNYDGKNDVIDFSVISRYGSFRGSIFDKYGKSIFKIDPKNTIWKGEYLGRPLPTDTYWYSLFWEDKISKKPVELSGWILLKNRD